MLQSICWPTEWPSCCSAYVNSPHLTFLTIYMTCRKYEDPYQYFTDCCTWPSNKHNSYHSWNDWYDNECIVITSHCVVPCYLLPPACLLWTFPSKNMYLKTSVKVVATDTSHVTWQVFVSLCSTYESCDWKWLNNLWPYYICNCFFMHFNILYCIYALHYYNTEFYVHVCTTLGLTRSRSHARKQGEWDGQHNPPRGPP